MLASLTFKNKLTKRLRETPSLAQLKPLLTPVNQTIVINGIETSKEQRTASAVSDLQRVCQVCRSGVCSSEVKHGWI
jgi:formaldehyde-activating enzyme involved in methanogenesis